MTLQELKTKGNRSIIIGIIIGASLALLFKSCNDNSKLLISKSKDQQKENKALLSELNHKTDVINILNEKIALKEDKIQKLLSDIPKVEKETDKKIIEVNNYNLTDFKRFFTIATGSNEIEIKGNELAFKSIPLDSLAKTVIYSGQYEFERNIYKNAFNLSQEKNEIKDTIIGIQQEGINELKTALINTDDLNQDLSKQLNKANRPKIGQILLGIGIGLISGLVIQK